MAFEYIGHGAFMLLTMLEMRARKRFEMAVGELDK